MAQRVCNSRLFSRLDWVVWNVDLFWPPGFMVCFIKSGFSSSRVVSPVARPCGSGLVSAPPNHSQKESCHCSSRARSFQKSIYTAKHIRDRTKTNFALLTSGGCWLTKKSKQPGQIQDVLHQLLPCLAPCEVRSEGFYVRCAFWLPAHLPKGHCELVCRISSLEISMQLFKAGHAVSISGEILPYSLIFKGF